MLSHMGRFFYGDVGPHTFLLNYCALIRSLNVEKISFSIISLRDRHGLSWDFGRLPMSRNWTTFALVIFKVYWQKSGYFARSAKANKRDLELIKRSAHFGAEQALKGNSGLAGLDDDQENQLKLIDFKRIKGGKPFDTSLGWYQSMLKEIGQN